MSDQRPPAHTRASKEYDYSEGRHPSDDLLLASVRQQHLDNRIQIEQHINECPFCRHKCHAFEQDGRLLSPYMQEQKQQFYPSITNRVMQRVALENRLTRRERILADLQRAYKYSLLEGIVQKILGQQRGQAQAENREQGLFVSPLSPLTDEPLPVPFAALRSSGALCSGPTGSRRSAPRSFRRLAIALVVVAAVLTLMIGLLASPIMKPVMTESHAQQTPPSIPRQHNTSIPVTSKSPSAQTKTPTPTHSGPQIVFCSTPSQLKRNIVQICGSGFTKYGRVWLAVYGFNVVFPRTADGRGNINITFTVNDCRLMPLQITAFDASSRRIATLQISSLSSCSSSRHH